MRAETSLIDEIKEKAELIAKALKKGDVEIRKSANGISIMEIKKTVIAK